MNELTFVHSLVRRKPVSRKPRSELRVSPFIKIINQSSPVMIRKSDWRINITHVAKQVASRHLTVNLRQSLPTDVYDVMRAGSAYQGTYVDFYVGIEWCRELGLNDLIDKLLQLKPFTSEQIMVSN